MWRNTFPISPGNKVYIVNHNTRTQVAKYLRIYQCQLMPPTFMAYSQEKNTSFISAKI